MSEKDPKDLESLATDPGADQQQETTPDFIDRRSGTIDDIMATRRQILEQDGVTLAAEEKPEEAEPEGDQPPSGEGDAPKAPATTKPAAEVEQLKIGQLLDDHVYEITVDGRPQHLTGHQLKSAAQIEGASRSRLEAATKTLNQVLDLQAAIARCADKKDDAERDATVAGAKKPGDETRPAVFPGIDKIDFADLTRKLQFGEPEDATKALRDVVSSLMTLGAGGDPAATQETIRQGVLDQIEWRDAMKRFGTEFKDVLEDPILRGLCGNIADTLWNETVKECQEKKLPRPEYWQIWETAGKHTQQWVSKIRGKDAQAQITDANAGDGTPPTKPGQPKVTVSKDREVHKTTAALTPTPRGSPSTPRTPTAPKTEDEEIRSRRVAIQEMAESRGQHL